MKKLLFIPAFILFSACGGSSESKEQISEEEETEIVKAINSDLEEAQEELKIETEESLTEIDSLLENF
ncbi:MAG: hypothetical protein AB8B73_05130 [Ekhidna sp.]